MGISSLIAGVASVLTGNRPPVWIRLSVYAVFVVVASLSVARVVLTCHDPYNDTKYAEGLADFHNAVYYPALAFRQGVNPYSQAYAEQFPVNRQYPLYSPATLLLYYPFAVLPLEVGNVVYFVYSFALVFGLALSVIIICRLPRTAVHLFAMATLVLLSRPGHINLMLGQSTLPMVLGAIWALELARRRPALAGIALALTTLKPTFGVPLIWLMFCRRDFRAVFVGVAIGAAAALAGAAPLIAHDGLAIFLTTLRESQNKHDADPLSMPTSTWTRLDALSVISRLAGSELGESNEAVVAAVCLLLAGAAVYRTSALRGLRHSAPEAEGADSLSAVIISTATLACIYHSNYDALLLLLPWVGATCGRIRDQLPAWAQPVLWVLLTVPAVNFVSTRTVIERFGLDEPAWFVVTCINGMAVLAALLLSAAIAFSGFRRESALVKSPRPVSA